MGDIVALNPEHTPPAEDVSELASCLRGLADELERGDFGKVKHVAVIIDNLDDPLWVCHRTIGHMTKMEWLGLLQILVTKQANALV